MSKLHRIFLLSLFVLSLGCVKDRPDRAAPGSGLDRGDVVEKSVFDNKIYSLKTGARIRDNEPFEFEVEQSDDPEFLKYGFNDFSFVEFETDFPFFAKNKDKIRIRGKENYSYELHQKIEGDQLDVYKVGAADSIPYVEKSRAVEFPGGKLGVRLVSYKLRFFNKRDVVDNDNDDTRQDVEQPEGNALNYDSATHVSIDYNPILYTERELDKAGVFPKSFFEGEWYYSVFKIDSSDYVGGGNHFFFLRSPEDRSIGIFRRVRFDALDESSMGAVRSAGPKILKERKLSNSILARFNVDWVAYRNRVNTSGGIGAEMFDSQSNSESSTHVRLKMLESFPQLSKNFRAGKLLCAKCLNVSKLVKIIVGSDILSYVIEGDLVRYRVNFYRVKKNNNYKPIASHFDDFDRFGFLSMFVPVYILGHKLSTDKDAVRLRRKIRFNPEKKEIVYHISKTSPREPIIESVAKRSIGLMDKVFQHIYKDSDEEPIRVVLSPKRVEPGDPRYNVLDFNSLVNPSTMGGIGNPYYDEITGEIIAATSFIYYGQMKHLAERALVEFLSNKTGFYAYSLSTSMPGEGSFPGSFFRPEASGITKPLLVYAEPWQKQTLSELQALGGSSAYSMIPVKARELTHLNLNYVCTDMDCANSKKYDAFDQGFDFQTTTPKFLRGVVNVPGDEGQSSHALPRISKRSVFKYFDENCPVDELARLFRSLEGSAEVRENSTFQQCVMALLEPQLVQTTVHELNHNFSEDHNFHGTGDEDNYITEEFVEEVFGEKIEEKDIKASTRTSTIMDYTEYRSSPVIYPGPYDVAVMRYLYRDQVEMVNSNTSQIEYADLTEDAEDFEDDFGYVVTNVTSIKTMEHYWGEKAKYYEFCTDEDEANNWNPECAKFDLGATPSEMVRNYVDEFKYIEAFARDRGTRIINPRAVRAAKQRIFKSVYKFYLAWRVKLKNLLGEQDKYLESFDTTEEFYKEFVDRIDDLDDPKDRANYLEYFKVRTRVYNFLRWVLFTAPASCVYSVSHPSLTNPQLEFVDFDKIYQSLLARSSIESSEDLVAGCSSPQAKAEGRRLLIKRYERKLDLGWTPGGSKSIADFNIRFLGKSGAPISDYNYVIERGDRPDQPDVLGFAPDKIKATFLINARIQAPIYGDLSSFVPSMLDEPEFRKNMETLIKARLYGGYWLNPSAKSEAGQFNNSGMKFTYEDFDYIENRNPDGSYTKLLGSYIEPGGLSYSPEGPLSFESLVSKYVETHIPAIHRDGDVVRGAESAILNQAANHPYYHDVLIERRMKEGSNIIQAFRSAFGFHLIPTYTSEIDLLPRLFALYRLGVSVPGNSDATRKRTKSMKVDVPTVPDVSKLERAVNNAADVGRFWVVARQGSSFAIELIKNANQLKGVLKAGDAKVFNIEVINRAIEKMVEVFPTLDKFQVMSPYDYDGIRRDQEDLIKPNYILNTRLRGDAVVNLNVLLTSEILNQRDEPWFADTQELILSLVSTLGDTDGVDTQVLSDIAGDRLKNVQGGFVPFKQVKKLMAGLVKDIERAGGLGATSLDSSLREATERTLQNLKGKVSFLEKVSLYTQNSKGIYEPTLYQEKVREILTNRRDQLLQQSQVDEARRIEVQGDWEEHNAKHELLLKLLTVFAVFDKH